MILTGTITKPAVTDIATICIYPTRQYNSITQQVIVSCSVTTQDGSEDKHYTLTPEQTELRGKDDSYVINMICQNNNFTPLAE